MISTRYVTNAQINRQADLAAQLTTVQNQVSTKKRLAAPSDDPSASARISDIRQTQAYQKVWSNNTDTGSAIASAADNNLTTVTDLISQARSLLLQGSNDATTAPDRTTILGQIRDLATQLQTYATASDPTGAPLFPDGTPLAIPVSDSLSLPATASRDSVFNQVSVPGGTTMTISDILNGAADALAQSDPAQRASAVATSVAQMKASVDHMAQVQADQGVRMQRFTQAKADLSDSGTNLTNERSGLEDTDLTYAAAQFSALQLSLNAAQAMFVQTHKTSMFDLLG